MSRLFRFVPEKWRARSLEAGIVEAVGRPLDGWTTTLLSVRQYFRPYAAPSSSLDWLMGVVSLPEEPKLSDARKRALIDVAWKVWPRKGVTEAIRWWIWALSGVDACVESRANTAFVAGWSKTGTDPGVDRVDEVGPGALAHWYDICIPLEFQAELPEAEVRRLVAHVAPVYAFFDVTYSEACDCSQPTAPQIIQLTAPTLTAAGVDPALTSPPSSLWGPSALTDIGKVIVSPGDASTATYGVFVGTTTDAINLGDFVTDSGTINSIDGISTDTNAHSNVNMAAACEGETVAFSFSQRASDDSAVEMIDLSDGSKTLVRRFQAEVDGVVYFDSPYGIDVSPADGNLLIAGKSGATTGGQETLAIINRTTGAFIGKKRVRDTAAQGNPQFSNNGALFVSTSVFGANYGYVECWTTSGFGASSSANWQLDMLSDFTGWAGNAVQGVLRRDKTGNGWWFVQGFGASVPVPYLYHITTAGVVDKAIDLRPLSGISGLSGKDCFVPALEVDKNGHVRVLLDPWTGGANPAPTGVNDILRLDSTGAFVSSTYADGLTSLPQNINDICVNDDGDLIYIDNSGNIRAYG